MFKRIWLFALTFFILLLFSSCGSPPDIAQVTQVVRVIDGDTIAIEGGERVRYIGIDTPEVYPDVAAFGAEAFGVEAWRANRKLVEGKRVRLERDVSERDKYGRLLRYVWVDNVMVNAELVRLGLAQAKAYPPDTKYQDYLERVEIEAKRAGRGIWHKK